MQRITNIIKPSILKKGKYQSKVTDDESDEMPLKQSQSGASRRGSFQLTKKDSSRSITSQDQTLQSSISTFNSSISSLSSVPHHYDDPLSGNEESYSSLKHIEDLKPRHSSAAQDGEQVKLSKPRRRLSLGSKRSTKPQAVSSTSNVPKMNPRRSRTVQAEQEVPRKIISRSLSSRRAPRLQRSIPDTDSKANAAPQMSTVRRSSSSRRITDYTDSKANVAPRISTTTGSCSLNDFMEQYDEIMVKFPDARDYGGSKSVTGW